MNKVIAFEKLNERNYWIALVLSKAGFDVWYLYLETCLEDKYENLEKQGIKGLRFSLIPNSLKTIFEYSNDHIITLSNELLYKVPLFDNICKTLKLNKTGILKLKATIDRQILDKGKGLLELFVFSEHYFNDPKSNKKRSIILFTQGTGTHKLLLKVKPKCCHIISLGFLNWIFTINKFFTRACYRNPKIRQLVQQRDEQKPSTVDFKKYEVLFFPHVGIFYSKFFIKDHYYNSDPSSPFYFENILHLSLGEDPSRLTESYSYYSKRKIPFTDLFSENRLPLKNSLLRFLKILFRSPFFLIKILSPTGFHCFSFYFSLMRSIDFCLLCLEKFSSARIALVGYDLNFSPVLSFALSLKNVKTVAVQERFICAWYDLIKPSLDHYLVAGEVVKKHLLKSKGPLAIENIDPVGLVRTELILQSQNQSYWLKNNKYSKIKETRKIILALDAHSETNRNADRFSYTNTWENNALFYNEIIQLANRFHDAYFIIKGKNYDFMTLPFFSDILKKIRNSKNITVETDYDTYTPEKIAALSDICVAVNTSFADELLSTGKSVIIRDYCGVPSQFFDYDNLPVISKDYIDLESKVASLLNGDSQLSETQKNRINSYFYTNSIEGNVRKKVQKKLLEIYTTGLGA